jgi:NADP-dependent 3-hydroxy acid dehydrogenase YdfG
MENTKTILVTGAGSGIGRAISQYLSKNAYTLVLLGRNLNNLEETKKFFRKLR